MPSVGGWQDGWVRLQSWNLSVPAAVQDCHGTYMPSTHYRCSFVKNNNTLPQTTAEKGGSRQDTLSSETDMTECVTRSLMTKWMLRLLRRWICVARPNDEAQRSTCHLAPLWISHQPLRSVLFFLFFCNTTYPFQGSDRLACPGINICYLHRCFSFVISRLSADCGRNIHLNDKQRWIFV